MRYFEQVFAPKLDAEAENMDMNHSNINHFLNFYFTNSCHLLVHNVHAEHNIKFIRIFEETLIKFLRDKEMLFELFKFA